MATWRTALRAESKWTMATQRAYAWHLERFEGWLGSLRPTSEHMTAFLEGRLEAGVSRETLRQAHCALSWAAALWQLEAPALPQGQPADVELWEALLWRLHTAHGLSPQQLARLRVHHVDGSVLRYGRRPVRLSGALREGLRRVAHGRALTAPLFSDPRGRPLSPRRLGQHIRRVERVS